MGNFLGNLMNLIVPRSAEMTKHLNGIEKIREQVAELHREADAMAKALEDDDKLYEAQKAEWKLEEAAKRNILAEAAKSKGPESYAAFLEQEKIENEAEEINDARLWVETLQCSMEDQRKYLDALGKDHPAYASFVQIMTDSQPELEAAKVKLADLLSKKASSGV